MKRNVCGIIGTLHHTLGKEVISVKNKARKGTS